MEALFLQMVNMSITASYVILFVLLARFFLRHTPKIFSYLLWAVVGIRLIFPFSFESVWSLLPFRTAPISPNGSILPTSEVVTGFLPVDQSFQSLIPAPDLTASVNPMQVVVFVLTWIWIVGLLMLIVYSTVSAFFLRRKLQGAHLYQENIYKVKGLETAFVFGLFHPKIYLPAHLAEDEQSYIILHEKIHIRRKDHWIKLLAFLLVCLHWMNPLVWLAFICMTRDMEMSCDESVLREMGDDIKKSYSNSLLSLATKRKILNDGPLAFGEGGVKGRILNILSYKKPTLWVVCIGLVVVGALIFGLLANPTKEKGKSLLEMDGIISAKQLSLYHVSAFVMSESDELIFQMRDNEMVQITALQEFIKQLKVEKTPLSQNRSMDREKRKQLTFYRADKEYVTFYFSADGSVVWMDNDLKSSLSYRVMHPEQVIQFFSEQLQTKTDTNDWAAQLLSYQTKYVGDASKVGGIVRLLRFPTTVTQIDGISLQTKTKPYQIRLSFQTDQENLEKYKNEEKREVFYYNAYVLLALIENVEGIVFDLTDGQRIETFEVTREMGEQAKGEPLLHFAKNPEKLSVLLQDIVSKSILESTSVVQEPMIYFQNRLYTQSKSDIDVDIKSLEHSGRVQYIVQPTEVPTQDVTANRVDLLEANIYGTGMEIWVLWNEEYKRFVSSNQSLHIPLSTQEILNKLQEYPQNYTSTQAAKDGMYVKTAQGNLNESVVLGFIAKVQKGISTQMICVQYTTEGDPILANISYDGKRFWVILDTSRDPFGGDDSKIFSYEHLSVLESADEKRQVAILSDESLESFEQLFKLQLSSQSGLYYTLYDGS